MLITYAKSLETETLINVWLNNEGEKPWEGHYYKSSHIPIFPEIKMRHMEV